MLLRIADLQTQNGDIAGARLAIDAAVSAAAEAHDEALLAACADFGRADAQP
jgi:hypothetical protein